MGFWADGFWADGFWADGFWSGNTSGGGGGGGGPGSGTITITLAAGATGNGFRDADVGRLFVAGTGSATIATIVDELEATATVVGGFDSASYAAGGHRLLGSPLTTLTPSAVGPVGTSITLTTADDAWRPQDVGSIVRINGGIVRITAVDSDTVADGTVTQVLSATTAAPADAWSLEPPMWNAYDGYPAAVAFHEQRLAFAGSPGDPQAIAASQAGASFDFTPGTLDTDAWVRTIASDEQNAIEYLGADSVLMVLTYGGEFTVRGGVEKPITPTNIQVKPKSTHGAARVRPVRVHGERVFVQRSGRQVVSMTYAEENDTFDTDELSLLSEHLFEPGVVEMAFQRRPVPLLYAVLASGDMVVASIDRKQNILGWTRWETQGDFESVCVIPRGAVDEVWVSVKRTIGGQERRFIERFVESWEARAGETGFDYGYTLDAAAEATAGSPSATVSGLSHLAGETVQVVGDGYYLGEFVVSGGGTVTLPDTYAKTLTGLGYTTRVKPLPPEMPTVGGTARGRPVRATEATLILHKSIGGAVDGQPLPTRTFDVDGLGAPPPLFTGDRRIDGGSGWVTGGTLMTIEQDEPMPFHLLALVQKLVVNP